MILLSCVCPAHCCPSPPRVWAPQTAPLQALLVSLDASCFPSQAVPISLHFSCDVYANCSHTLTKFDFEFQPSTTNSLMDNEIHQYIQKKNSLSSFLKLGLLSEFSVHAGSRPDPYLRSSSPSNAVSSSSGLCFSQWRTGSALVLAIIIACLADASLRLSPAHSWARPQVPRWSPGKLLAKGQWDTGLGQVVWEPVARRTRHNSQEEVWQQAQHGQCQEKPPITKGAQQMSWD